MNVVIFGKGFGKPRQLNLTGIPVVLVAVACTSFLSAAGFAGGYWYSSVTGSGISVDEVAILADELQLQRNSIETIRQGNEDTLDALAIRIAQMNARIIRLDALGRRLTDMADLEDGEFDFDSVPALGGPEEPVATGSNVAVPEVVSAMQSLGDQLNDREAQLGVLESVSARCVLAGYHPISVSELIHSLESLRTIPASISQAKWVRKLRWSLTVSLPGPRIDTVMASWLKSIMAMAIRRVMRITQKTSSSSAMR